MGISMKQEQGVLFVFYQEGKILCEERVVDGIAGNYITGGRCEPGDFQSDNYKLATLQREVEEELGVKVLDYQFIGSYPFKQYLFHACIVYKWTGEIPDRILDNGRPTYWVEAKGFIPAINLKPLRILLENHLF